MTLGFISDKTTVLSKRNLKIENLPICKIAANISEGNF
jgi:hypothetical protein